MVKLSLRVVPGASRNEISFAGGLWKIRLTAPPVEGKANLALLVFIADKLDLNRSQVELTAGKTSRNKTVVVYGLSKEEIDKRLANI